jgi:hypothetical protein
METLFWFDVLVQLFSARSLQRAGLFLVENYGCGCPTSGMILSSVFLKWSSSASHYRDPVCGAGGLLTKHANDLIEMQFANSLLSRTNDEM